MSTNCKDVNNKNKCLKSNCVEFINKHLLFMLAFKKKDVMLFIHKIKK